MISLLLLFLWRKPINPLRDSLVSLLYAIRELRMEKGNFIGTYAYPREVLISSRETFSRECWAAWNVSTKGNFRRNVVNLRQGALSRRRNGFIKGVIDSPGRGDSGYECRVIFNAPATIAHRLDSNLFRNSANCSIRSCANISIVSIHRE